MTRHFVMREDGSVEPADLFEWARWFETSDRVVKKTVLQRVKVSTVFVGIDMGFGLGGPPLIFETMVFSNDSHKSEILPRLDVHEEMDQERHATRDEAIQRHDALVRKWAEIELTSQRELDKLVAERARGGAK